MIATNESVILFSELAESVKALGATAVTNILQKARSGSVSLEDKNIDMIINMVCDHYHLTYDKMITSQNKSYTRQLAIAFSTFYLHRYFGYSLSDLSLVFRRHKSQLSRASNRVKSEIESENGVIYETSKIFLLKVNTHIINSKKVKE